MLDLHRLALLHRFSKLGSIAATAGSFGYSPSAVSQQLAVLEREVGAALLERTPRSAELTDLGQRLAWHAATILDAVETAEADLASYRALPVGRVVVAAAPTAALALAPALAGLRDRYEQLEVVVRQAAPDAALADLDAREVDIAVVDDWSDAAPAERSGCDVRRLLRDPVGLALPGPHPAAEASGPLELHEVSQEAWICAPPGEPSRTAFDRVMADAGIRPVVGWEFQGLTTIAGLVGHGVGIALLPRLAVTFSSAAGDIVLREPSIALARHFDAVTRTAARDRPAIQTVVAAIADELAVHR